MMPACGCMPICIARKATCRTQIIGIAAAARLRRRATSRRNGKAWRDHSWRRFRDGGRRLRLRNGGPSEASPVALRVGEATGAGQGWHWSFCLELDRWRATPEQRGLMMAPDHGGSCAGLLYGLVWREIGFGISAPLISVQEHAAIDDEINAGDEACPVG